MRKIKRKNRFRRKRKNGLKIFIPLFFLLFIFSSAYALMNRKIKINGTASIGSNNTYSCSDMTVESKWFDTYQSSETTYTTLISFKLTNTSNSNIENWKGSIKGPTSMIVSYNGSNYGNYIANSQGIATIEPPFYHEIITPNQTIEFQIGVTTSEVNHNIAYIELAGCQVYGSGSIDPISDDDDDDVEVALESLSISPSSYTMTVDDEKNLIVTKNPTNAEADLTWSSSDSSIVSVDENGKITAHASGSVTITVSSGNIKGTSSITVKEKTSSSDASVSFTRTGWWGTEIIQFGINVQNNSSENLSRVSFYLDVPAGTTYDLWSNFSQADNVFTTNDTIYSNSTSTYYGQMHIPDGYDPSEYLNPNIIVYSVE